MHVLAMARVLLSVYKIQLNHYSKPKNMLMGLILYLWIKSNLTFLVPTSFSRECQKYDITLRVVY